MISPTKDKMDQAKYAISINASMIVLMLFAFFRPITVSFPVIAGVSILDLFGILMSYLILVALFIKFREIELDVTSSLMIFFSIYCILSFTWGSYYRDVIRMIFPFLPFFLTKNIIKNRESAVFTIKVLFLGYIVPVIGSTVMILSGTSEIQITGSMVERQAGLSSGVHTLAHLMLFYSYCFVLYLLWVKEKSLFRVLGYTLLFLSILCLIKTYTRTVFLGGIFFWFSQLFFWKRRVFFILLTALLFASPLFYDDIKNIVFQERAFSKRTEEVDLNTATSGRIWIWKYNMEIFSRMPITRQILGVGLGKELQNVPGERYKAWVGSHNDYLSLMIMTGVIGVVLYILIYLSVIYTLARSPLDRKVVIFGVIVIISVMLMNFVSNSYIVRFQMAQLLWFLIGLLYSQFSMEKGS